MVGIQLFKKRAKEFLALDIGTSATKALFFRKNGEKITILGMAQEYFEEFGIFDSQGFKEDILKKNILKVIEDLERKTNQKAEGIFLSLPANVLRLGLAFPKILRKNSKEKINKREERELKEEIFKIAQKEISQGFEREFGILAKELSFLSLKILEMKIDGYYLPRFEGYNGQSLEARVLATFLSKNSLDYYLKIFQNFSLPILNISHYAQNLAKVFDIKEALFLDIGGETTQIFLVKNWLLERIDTFELGGNFFSQILSEHLGLPVRDSQLLKERYSQGELSEESRVRIREILAPGVKEWFSKLKSRLRKFANLLPSEIFLFGGGSLLSDLKEILEKGDWEDLSFLAKVRPKLLLPKDLKNINNNIEKANSPQFTPILLFLLSSFLNNYGKKNF